MKPTVWTIDTGIWSPRDGKYGWRDWDSYPTQAAARKEITKLLKQDPDYPIMLSQVTVLEAWNHNKPPSWAKAKEEAQADSVQE